MPTKPTTGPVRLKTRRALRKWIRENLRGEVVLESVSPAPVPWEEPYTKLRPTPAPRTGRIVLLVGPGEAPANTRIVKRCFELRVPQPRQWLASEDYGLPHSFRSSGDLRGVWDPVGLNSGSFWCSGQELVVHERAPRIAVVAPEWDVDCFDYTFAHPSDAPSPAWWLATALEAGFNMAPIDHRGFVVPLAEVAAQSHGEWRFAERTPLNLSKPLSFEVTHWSNRWHSRVNDLFEPDRAKALQTALDAAFEALPGLRVQSGNCEFSFDEWQRILARAKATAEAKCDEERERDAEDDGSPVADVVPIRRRSPP